MDSDRAALLVVQARAGDQYATDELISGHLPLLYNIVGRALGGHSDTDDVVQETLLRAMDGLHGLRDPAGFRSWLVAIAMNQIRRRHHERMQTAYGADGLGDAYDVADPGADFVDLTIVRLGLSGQRREVAEATRWLDEADRELLALWWLEAAGELTRAELAGALELPPQHAAVRVQRMKGQLETARVVVRALAVADRCGPLSELTARWDGVPSALWRKRIARHARECAICSRHWSGLFPAEGLLAGLAMVPVSAGDLGALGAYLSPAPAAPAPAPTHDPVSHGRSVPRSHRRGSGGRGAHRGASSARPRMPLAVGGTVAVTAATAAIVAVALPGTTPRVTAEPPAIPAQVRAEVFSQQPSPAASSASPSPSPSASPTPTPSPSPTPSRTPSPKPTPTATRSKSPSPDPSTLSIKQQVVQLVNQERSKVGCTPVKSDDKLELAAQRHSDDMAARNFFDHTNPDGQGPQPRIDAAGYKWSSWGENIARGQRDAADVMKSWMDSPGHKANILNCGFTDLGVGVHLGAGGPWWTQDFGSAP
ncbi:sigma-70 family RNA polymerase sigma factor [Kitasatospora sp. DSM 101779]|uniref:sigma-70 family RNA polymerase sigma factor n=1 Tax=Kitasatospora sp. DSM 101779 TaxID=2853165 RepID=UPI0021D87E64|nr:sigma-70 family RNA polymerase sigma factor [Kitasatospora sp. DSM 101779]MCU7826147.1 sigma-70 family RNA polymerase sigma factor [Kitasatospora sp. DSM 101779]